MADREQRGLILCVCQATCPSFGGMDFFEILNCFRHEGLVEWVSLHPQLCADDGDAYLKELLTGSKTDKLYVAGCDPTMQRKMFRDAFAAAGFPQDRFVGIEIRNLKTEQVIAAIKKAMGVEEPQNQKKAPE